jgi:hypothetical protein
METDAALVMAMSVLIWQYGKAGMWALLGGMLRYLFVLAGWLLPWMARPLTPTLRARIITVCHIVGFTGLAPALSRALSALCLDDHARCLVFSVDVRRLCEASECAGPPSLALLALNASLTFGNIWPTLASG